MAEATTRSTGRPRSCSRASLNPKKAEAYPPGGFASNSTRKSRSLRSGSKPSPAAEPNISNCRKWNSRQSWISDVRFSSRLRFICRLRNQNRPGDANHDPNRWLSSRAPEQTTESRSWTKASPATQEPTAQSHVIQSTSSAFHSPLLSFPSIRAHPRRVWPTVPPLDMQRPAQDPRPIPPSPPNGAHHDLPIQALKQLPLCWPRPRRLRPSMLRLSPTRLSPTCRSPALSRRSLHHAGARNPPRWNLQPGRWHQRSWPDRRLFRQRPLCPPTTPSSLSTT